jgi:8-oxo-dGTP diphosphatase
MWKIRNIMHEMNKRFTIRAAVGLLLVKDGKILLLRRFNTGWEDGKYSLISGHLEGNESVTATIIREAKEEIGITISKENICVVNTTHRKLVDSEYIDFFVSANKWEGEPIIMEPNKCDDLRWFSVTELPDNLVPHIKEIVGYEKNRITYSEIGWD